MNEIINQDNYINFNIALKTIDLKGHLVYEYNPFRNYRLNEDIVYYDGLYIKVEDFISNGEYLIPPLSEEENLRNIFRYKEAYGILIIKLVLVDGEWKDTTDKPNTIDNFQTYLRDRTKSATFYKKGLLVDFITDELDFDLSNPVNITPQWSYDNSVNLIINDGKNPPRLINSRFSPTERNEYQICDRKGNDDTNIYDLGELFDIDTSLYKKTTTIPELTFMGINYGGNLPIGNYHFYFKYVDEDGNESDFFAESGLVSIFIGNSADSIYSGFHDENSHKLVKFLLENTDVSYSKVIVYYTRSTSDIFEEAVVKAMRIDEQYPINLLGIINITGYESVDEVTLDDINMLYLLYGSVETLAAALNMLFLANVDKPNIDYDDLADCALRFCPTLYTESYPINLIGNDYTGSIKNTYYDPNYIYSKVGYWDDEIYRFGVVFIKSDNTLTEVFNVRGIDSLTKDTLYQYFKLWDTNADTNEKSREYINYDEYTYNIITSTGENAITSTGENARGIVRIDHSNFKDIIGIRFEVSDETLTYLKETLKIKGLFFVRQKRIPTTLCQAYTIGVDSLSHTPVLPVSGSESGTFLTEGFLNLEDGTLGEDLDPHKITLDRYQCRDVAAICPDYDVNSPYLNSLFTASEFSCREYTNAGWNYLELNNRQLIAKISDNATKDVSYLSLKVLGVEDNVKLVAINDTMFSARAGEAEEGFRYEYAGIKKVDEENYALLRGSYGPFLGITGYANVGKLIDIKIPDYSVANVPDYFLIRSLDKSPYYAISDRINLYKNDLLIYEKGTRELTSGDSVNINTFKPVFRGDCYICQFTHRFNRNFQDPSAPTNNDIVDPDTWKDNFTIEDGIVKTEEFEKINLGDLNAVPLGLYITLTVRSTMNLNIRAIDDSIVDEVALTGHPRGFYPYSPLTVAGTYKTPEALCYNKGFEKSVSERYNFEVPDVPWIKDEFSNRIAYSNILVNDAFQNGWRTFVGSHYRDYPKTYGSITKLIELGGNLLCVFEHGVALISVNERALAGEGSGGAVYINTSNVLPENPKVISDKYGSQWRDSIIKTPSAVYGVDTVARKIWKTNGDTMEYISDNRVQEFLNNNISLTERELTPILGIRNVKTHYNEFKGDVMFTFYDNLEGFSEKVWNLCWNEKLLKWITFYSWVPSYSENIYNQYFSFDRNTSKWIAKLGISNSKSQFADGIVLDNVIIEPFVSNTEEVKQTKSSKESEEVKTPEYAAIVGKLNLKNRIYPNNSTIEYNIIRDNYGNYKYFDIITIDNNPTLVIRKTKKNEESSLIEYSDLCSELYVRKTTNEDVLDFSDPDLLSTWRSEVNAGEILNIATNDRGLRISLETSPSDKRINGDKIVRLLNILATVRSSNNDIESSETVDATYLLTIAVITKYNMQFLTTDFWKHGLAGIIDIADKIYPTYWYGKLHPFEFEFVVAENPELHKIFDNLEFISNKAEPESFHYEVVGECYDFAKDKKNMYIRLEATKELLQYNGEDIEFNENYKLLDNIPRDITTGENITSNYSKSYYDKSTIFPLYYYRKDTINEIEDSYHLHGYKDHYEKGTKNFSALAGAEIVKYDNLDEYRIWNHSKAVNMNDPELGRLRGNMQYIEDRWKVQINSINVAYKNETPLDWRKAYPLPTSEVKAPLVPAELNLFTVVDENNIGATDKQTEERLYLPEDWERNVVRWNEYEKLNKEVKLKDKYIKIRVRYSGKDLAIISAIKTLYRISYA